MGYAIESVRLIRDKATGASKGFGFVKFFFLEHAKSFMAAVMKEPMYIDGFYVRPDYSNNKMEDWKCSKVFYFIKLASAMDLIMKIEKNAISARDQGCKKSHKRNQSMKGLFHSLMMAPLMFRSIFPIFFF